MATIAVVRGGPSLDHKASLKSGQMVLDILREEPGMHRDIYIDKDGSWNERGRPVNPASVLRLVDGVINALHGPYGEDGTIQKIFTQHAIPYSGSVVLPSFLASHKALAKNLIEEEGIATPRDVLIESEEEISKRVPEAIRSFGHLLAVKSVFGEGGHFVRITTNPQEAVAAATELMSHGPVLLEEYMRGREVSVYVTEDFRGESVYAFPPLELVREGNSFREVCPARLTTQQREALTELARHVFKTLDLRHYAKIDFFMTPHNIYFLEANALPKIHENSLFAKAMRSVGANMQEFVHHIKDLALKG